MDSIGNYQVQDTENIRNAVKKMDAGGIGFIGITDERGKMIAVLTDGDFRRAVLKGTGLEGNIMLIANTSFKYLEDKPDRIAIEKVFSESLINQLPVLQNGKLTDILLREDYPVARKTTINETLNVPVVIMAGGKGTRLAPFTDILPKPLVPVGNKTMLEVIMDEYKKYGISNFFLSLNYKASLIKAYFEDKKNEYTIEYLIEDLPLGTAGALSLLKGKVKSTLFISNCDIIIKDNYKTLLDFHKTSGAVMTVVAAMQHHSIPYGVCDIDNTGTLIKMREKPKLDFLVNTGMYIIEPEVLGFVPENKLFHATDLIEALQEAKRKISVFPVTEKTYIDVGDWKEYQNNLLRF